MKKINRSLRGICVAVTVFAAANNVQAASFLNTGATGVGLYSTGVNVGGGSLITDNATDSHYQYAVGTGANAAAAYSSLTTSFSGGGTVGVTNAGGDNPTAATSWIGYNPTGNNSTWISLNNGASNTQASNSYFVYRTTFNLSGFDLNSVNIAGQWASDNRGRGVYINGVQIATLGIYGGSSLNANFGVGSLASFSISGATNLNAGANTIDFLYLNSPDDSTGVRVEFTNASGDTLVPEPASFVLLGLGMIGISLMRRRHA